MTPSRRVLEQLEALGRSGIERVPSSLADERRAWRSLVISSRDGWERAAEARTAEQIADLIRGIVLYARASGRSCGGSVSPVIPLYRALVKRAPAWEPEFTDWVVLQRTNPYEPFGDALGPTGISHRKLRLLQRERGIEEEKKRREREEAARQGRILRATMPLANAVRRGDLKAVRALLARGADASKALPQGGSLVALAELNGRDAMAELLRSLDIA